MNRFFRNRSLMKAKLIKPIRSLCRTARLEIAIPLALTVALALPVVLGARAAQAINTSQESSAKSGGNAEKGKRIFENQGCNRCHGSAGEGVSEPQKNGGAPQIAATRLPLAELVQVVRKPKGQMPPFSSQQVSDAQLADLYAFLQSVTPPAKTQPSSSTNAKNGQRLFTSYGCYECHGFQGQGSAQTGGSRLGPPQIPLSAFVSYVRQPTGQMPPYNAKTVSNGELEDMYAFLQSVPQPPPSKSISLLNQ
jgi:mono/diheme cytochrome c family protein